MDKIVFCGNVICDQVKMITRWPDKGMLVPITSMKRAVGGSVANTAVDLKTLDREVEVRALSKVGADDNGDYVIRVLESKGVDCSMISREKDVPTSFTDVMTVETTGERTFFNMHGADSRLVPEDVDLEALDCRIFHFGYLLLLDGMDAEDAEYGTRAARLLHDVQRRGIKTSIDIVSEQSERFARIVRPALKYCDYCIINEIEGSLATGVSSSDLKGISNALFDLGVRERVVIHKPEIGVTLGRDGDFVEVKSLKLPAGWIKGSVGAGDAFCAGALYSLLKGFDPEKTLRLASCAAACNLAVTDAVSGAKSLSETLALDEKFER